MTDRTQKTVSLQTVGCRLNQYETEKMGTALFSCGFRRAAPGEPADLYIINTCTVTHRADSTSRYLVMKAARENPNARIVVAGCYVDADAATIEGLEPVDLVVPNRDKLRLVEILSEKMAELFDVKPSADAPVLSTLFERFNRSWLKISDGCNQRCAFCILPTVRGPLRNRPVHDLLEEIGAVRKLGFEEVVLTGVNIGHYKNRTSEPQVKNLAHLCRIILSETDLPRLRLSSIEPQTVRDELLQVCADSNGRICRHMHMPLQSGSSRLLRVMRRPYDRDVYMKRVAEARTVQPNTIVGADVIVGFPGETDEDFAQTREIAESGLLDYLHVFSYSDRAGTQSSGSTEKVPPKVIKERNTILSGISARMLERAHQRQVGETLPVISEHVKPGHDVLYGIADNYVKVKLPTAFTGGRRICRVRIDYATPEYVTGKIIS
jgi:threonylcarbamoyladenosine tRNA methylthiotransferase MtaB